MSYQAIEYSQHPYHSDYRIVELAFDEMLKQQRTNGIILSGYKGTCNEEVNKQFVWETQRIVEVKRKILGLLDKI